MANHVSRFLNWSFGSFIDPSEIRFLNSIAIVYIHKGFSQSITQVILLEVHDRAVICETAITGIDCYGVPKTCKLSKTIFYCYELDFWTVYTSLNTKLRTVSTPKSNLFRTCKTKSGFLEIFEIWWKFGGNHSYDYENWTHLDKINIIKNCHFWTWSRQCIFSSYSTTHNVE